MTISGTVGIVTSGAMLSGQIAWGTGTSGQTWVQTTSGSYVSVSGSVGISGTVMATLSGGWTVLSGTVVIFNLSGPALSGQVSWGTGTSGQTWVQTTSGSYVSVSGALIISSGTVTLETFSSLTWRSSQNTYLSSYYGVVTTPTYLRYVEYHGTSATLTSSAFTVTHATAQGFNTLLINQNMSVSNGITDLVYIPANAYLLISGDSISIYFSNPNSVTCATRIVTGR